VPHFSKVRQLRSEDAVIQAKAVVAAREMLCMPLKQIQCISAGITPALVQLLTVSTAYSNCTMVTI
jgi:hypothetical protein